MSGKDSFWNLASVYAENGRLFVKTQMQLNKTTCKSVENTREWNQNLSGFVGKSVFVDKKHQLLTFI